MAEPGSVAERVKSQADIVHGKGYIMMSQLKSAWLVLTFVVFGFGSLIVWLLVCQVGFEHAPSWLTGLGTLGFALAALVSAFYALETYRASVELQRARWISGLFKRFYESERYKTIRQKIDYDDLEDMKAILSKDLQGERIAVSQERDLLDNLTDYLNFFEWISYLWKRKHIKERDYEALFDYYLSLFLEEEKKQLRDYIEKRGYENLAEFLVQLERKKRIKRRKE